MFIRAAHAFFAALRPHMSYVYKGCPCICAALRPHMSYYVYKGHPCICAALRLYMSYYVYMGHPFISVQYFPCTFFIISFLYIKHNFFNFIYSIYFHAKTPCECTRRTRGHLSYEKINFFLILSICFSAKNPF